MRSRRRSGLFLSKAELKADPKSLPNCYLRQLRHHHAGMVKSQFLCETPWDKGFTSTRVPSRLRELVSLANKKIPSFDPVDLISALLLWRHIYRQHHREAKSNPNHDTIYIFDRNRCLDESSASYLVRRDDPSTSFLPLSQTLIYNSCTLVEQSQKSDMFYLASRLHCRRHGSAMSDSPTLLRGLNQLETMFIPVHRLSPPYRSNNHKFGTASKNGVTVIGPSSSLLRLFHMSFPEGGHRPFHYALACHIIRNKPGKDPSRVADGKVHNILATVLNLRLTFGFTREQRSDYSKDHHAGVKLPLINVKHFKDCPPHLRRGLIYIMETATKLARRKVVGAFSNHLRSKVYAKRFNDKLGFPSSSNLFEYVDIVLSYNTILPAHLDKNNDHRPGYDHTVVYSYFTKVNVMQCRVACIMCIRTVVRANTEKLPT